MVKKKVSQKGGSVSIRAEKADQSQRNCWRGVTWGAKIVVIGWLYSWFVQAQGARDTRNCIGWQGILLTDQMGHRGPDLGVFGRQDGPMWCKVLQILDRRWRERCSTLCDGIEKGVARRLYGRDRQSGICHPVRLRHQMGRAVFDQCQHDSGLFDRPSPQPFEHFLA